MLDCQCSCLSVSTPVSYIDNTTKVYLFPLHLSTHCEVIESFCGQIAHPLHFFLLPSFLGCSLTPFFIAQLFVQQFLVFLTLHHFHKLTYNPGSLTDPLLHASLKDDSFAGFLPHDPK